MTEIESAANVFFGEFVPFENEQLIEQKTPETILFSKYFLQGLSKDAKQALELFLDADEDAFLVNGKMRQLVIKKMLREELKWSFKRIFIVVDELKEFSRSF